MLHTWPAFHGEGFELIIEDLLGLPSEPPILVEGYKLLPRLVAPLLSGPQQAVWLIPTPAFRRQALDQRGSAWSIAGRTSDPKKALAKSPGPGPALHRRAGQTGEGSEPHHDHRRCSARPDELEGRVAGYLRLTG
jgi:hypothetical protein